LRLSVSLFHGMSESLKRRAVMFELL